MASTDSVESSGDSSATVAQRGCRCGKGKRNLIVCIDGTSQKFGEKNSNVIALVDQIRKTDSDIPQMAHYVSGLGTSAKPSTRSLAYWRNQLASKIDLAIAWDVESNILDAYKWLCEQYQDGDRIFLFGFSRGAYQVRAVAGMIRKVGLLMPGHIGQTPFAFELYSEHNLSTNEKSKDNWREKADIFKRTFSHSDVPVHFVGVWDTVSSVGIVRESPLPFTTSCDHICYFRHALALDERRVKFLPEYVYGGMGDRHEQQGVDGSPHETMVEHDSSPDSNDDYVHVKEVWFSGTHSDVGGGNMTNHNLEMSGISLLWMRKQAEIAGLKFMPMSFAKNSLLKQVNKKPTESLTPAWWFAEVLPLKRLSYTSTTAHGNTRRPHFGGARVIVPGQKIHVSVLLGENYRPRAVFQQEWESWPEQLDWSDPAGDKRFKDLGYAWEKDLVHQRETEELLHALCTDDLSDLVRVLELVDQLAFMARFGRGECLTVVTSDKSTPYEKLTQLMNCDDPLVRLSAAVAHCELGYTFADEEQATRIAEKALGMLFLSDDQYQKRACTSLRPLCIHSSLRQKIINKEVFERLLYCSACDGGTRTVPVRVYNIQALTLLLTTLDGPEPVSEFLKIDDIFARVVKLLDPKNQLIMVSVLRLITFLSKTKAEEGTTALDRLSRAEEESLVDSIEKLLLANKGSLYVLSTAMDTILELSKRSEMMDMFVSRRFPAKLVDILVKRLFTDRRWAISSLASLMQNEIFAVNMMRSKFLLKIIKLLGSPTGYTAATEAIVSLSDKNAGLCQQAQARMKGLSMCIISAGKNKPELLEQLNRLSLKELHMSSTEYDELFDKLWKKKPLQAVYFIHKAIARADRLSFSLADALSKSAAPEVVATMLREGTFVLPAAERMQADWTSILSKTFAQNEEFRERVYHGPASKDLLKDTVDMIKNSNNRKQRVKGLANLELVSKLDSHHMKLLITDGVVDDLVDPMLDKVTMDGDQNLILPLSTIAKIGPIRAKLVPKLASILDEILADNKAMEEKYDLCTTLRLLIALVPLHACSNLFEERPLFGNLLDKCERLEKGQDIRKEAIQLWNNYQGHIREHHSPKKE